MKLKQWLTAGVLCTTASMANAATITDVEEVNAYVAHYFETTEFSSVTWVHDISDQGFVPNGPQTIDSGELTVSFSDDSEADILETAFVILNESGQSNTWSEAEVDTGDITGNLEIEALTRLNEEGLLEVQVRSTFGDFWVNDSTLTLHVTDVPEPASLALFGLGLAGLGMARRRTKA